MMGAARVGYSMSRDGLLPAWFRQDSPGPQSTDPDDWILGVVSAVLAGLFNIEEVAQLTNIGICWPS